MSSLPQSIFLLKVQVVFAEAAAEHKQRTITERTIAFDWQNIFVSSIKFDYRT